jgi:hypothetical protein
MIKSDIERRRSRRHRVEEDRIDADVELIWKSEAGSRMFECGRIADVSDTGLAVVCPQPLAASTNIILRAPGMGFVAMGQVRNCAWCRTQYRVGIHFVERAPISPSAMEPDADYFDVLRAGAAGQFEKVEKLYRTLAFKYHPDNMDTGNAEVFLRMKEMFRILSLPKPQQEESSISRPYAGFKGVEAYKEQRGRRLAVLGLLYHKRAEDYRNAAISADDLENLTGIGKDQMGFVLWYLLEKGAVTLGGYSSDYTISAAGVDLMEAVSLRD